MADVPGGHSSRSSFQKPLRRRDDVETSRGMQSQTVRAGGLLARAPTYKRYRDRCDGSEMAHVGGMRSGVSARLTVKLD